MTSSLVGSEMCIRDSPSCSNHIHSGNGRRTCMWDISTSVDEETRGPLPVSYTHLTLPTICSV
eukprot:5705017-Prorocentrum_lima.AAC.1